MDAGNSIFFHVKRIEDPIGLLPAKLILGINKRGVHFFRPVCLSSYAVSTYQWVLPANLEDGAKGLCSMFAPNHLLS